MAGLICSSKLLFLCIFASYCSIVVIVAGKKCEVYFPVVTCYFYYEAINKPIFFYGLLYNSKHVVTLGHDPYKVPTFVIAGFTVDPNEKIEIASDRSSIASFKSQDRYGNARILRNIGVFKLNYPIQQTDKIKYYKFPTQPLDIPIGTICMAKRYDENRKKFVENKYKIKPKIDCGKHGEIYVSICADWMEPTQKGWRSDSNLMFGTPLVCPVGQNNERIIVGLLAEYVLYSKTLKVFSDLSRLKSWFEENIEEEETGDPDEEEY